MTPTEYFLCFVGIVFFWFLKYSKDKDPYDDRDENFPLKKWVSKWLTKKIDNIIIHLFCSYFFLFMGANNLEAWVGSTVTLPDGMDEIGVAGFIGFSGSYIAELLKKGIKAEEV